MLGRVGGRDEGGHGFMRYRLAVQAARDGEEGVAGEWHRCWNQEKERGMPGWGEGDEAPSLAGLANTIDGLRLADEAVGGAVRWGQVSGIDEQAHSNINKYY